ncbi:glycosyltransferase family 39 protein [Thermoproteota archaeon]
MDTKKFSLVLIVSAGLALRLYCLGAQSLWFDEACTTFALNNYFPTGLKAAMGSTLQNLYYYFMTVWMVIFGVSEFSIRFPSLIFSVLSIFFIFQLSKELFDEMTGLIAAFLLSVSAYSINYAQEARMYSMLWFLGILSFLFFYRFLVRDRIIYLVLYIIFSVLAVYTAYIAFLFIIVQNIIFFIFFNKTKCKQWLVGQVVILLFYSPWSLAFIHAVKFRQGIAWIGKTEDYYGFLTYAFGLFSGSSFGAKTFLEPWIYWFLIVSALVGIVYAFKRRHRFVLSYCIVGLWIIIPIAVYCLFDALVYPVLQQRYIGFVHIPLVIFFSAGMMRYRVPIKTFILALLLFVAFSHVTPYYRNNLKIHGDDLRGLSVELLSRVREGDLIVANFNPDVMAYYYKECEISYITSIEDNINKDRFVFVVWRWKKPSEKELAGYNVEEAIKLKGVGLLKLKKN